MNKDLFNVDIAQSKSMERLNDALLEQVKTGKQALSLSISMSGATHESLATEIKKPRETLTRFLNCNGGLKLSEIENLINATGNLVILQFLARKFGYELKPIDLKARRIAELEAELKELTA